MALPSFVVLKSNYNNKYLRYIHKEVQVHGFLQFSGEEIVSPYSKIELEMAKSGNGLVHIRCCYNNKYFVRKSANHYWIVGAADQPEEDKSKWSCTLFELNFVKEHDTKILRLKHVQLGHYACLWRAAEPFTNCLYAASPDPDKDSCDVYTVIDWESLLILPKYVAFKGENGKYLSGRSIEGRPYLQFASNDIGDPTVGNEIFTTHDGTVHIKSNIFGKFWRGSPNWICADTDDTTNNDTLFWAIKVGSNIIALQNLKNKLFCETLTTEGKTECLNAGVSTISNEAKLEVAELVVSRKIYNVNYRLKDARIYNQKVITMGIVEAINKTKKEINVEGKLAYTKKKSSTWNSGVSFKLGVITSLKAGVPEIADGIVKVSTEFEGKYEWGETIEEKNSLETLYTLTVSPMTKATFKLIATVGACDVPFSYYQRDTLTDGKQITNNMEDGIYTGVNSFNYRYETSEETL